MAARSPHRAKTPVADTVLITFDDSSIAAEFLATGYRYFICQSAPKRGWHTYPSKSIPAGEIERFVVEQIKCVGRDPELIRETIAQVHAMTRKELTELGTDQTSLERELSRWHTEVRKLIKGIDVVGDDSPLTAQLADLHERIRGAGPSAAGIQVDGAGNSV